VPDTGGLQTASTGEGIDLVGLALPSSYAQTTRRQTVTIKVGRPDKFRFYRVHPDPAFRVIAPIISKDREFWYVAASLVPQLPSTIEKLVRPKLLLPCIDLESAIIIWPVPLSDPDLPGRDMWSESATAIAEVGQSRWGRIVANTHTGANEYIEAESNFPDPIWPSLTYNEMLVKGFASRILTHIDHPFFQKLLGKAK
jgi:hypothetical protein